MSQSFAMDYIDVAARIVEFRTKHPDGSLQPADLSSPYKVETIGDQTFVVVVAAAYRTADDPKPGIGMAYEVFPGRTPYTRGSELQNAETSAWGRAIVAALAADTKKGIASAEEVRNRQAERDDSGTTPIERKATRTRTRDANDEYATNPVGTLTDTVNKVMQVGRGIGMTPRQIRSLWASRHGGEDILQTSNREDLEQILDAAVLGRIRDEVASSEAVPA